MRPAILFLVVLCSSGCGTPTSSQDPTTPQWPPLPPGARPVQVEPIEMMGGTISGFQARDRVVIDDQREWRSFWETVQAGHFPKTEPPSVDFGRNRIVAGMMGQRNTGGYAISIAGVFESADHTIVRVLETSPGRHCGLIQVITSPVTAATIPRSSLSVQFVDAGVTVPCN